MEALAQELLAKAERRGSMDVVSDYAEPLADYMIGELLGLPDTPIARSSSNVAIGSRSSRWRDASVMRRS